MAPKSKKKIVAASPAVSSQATSADASSDRFVFDVGRDMVSTPADIEPGFLDNYFLTGHR